MGKKKKIIIVMVAVLMLGAVIFSIYWFMNKRTVPQDGVHSEIEVTDNRYKEMMFDKTEIKSDVVYGTAKNYKGENEDLKLDVYTGAGDTASSRAAVILVHGGSFTGGDKANASIIKSSSEDYAKLGYVVFNINYRLDSSTSSRAIANAVEDVASAFTWVQENASEYGVDKNNIFVGGYSAGAVAVVNAVYSNLASIKMDRSGIAGVIDVSGMNLYSGSPVANNPACFIIHGTKDTTDPYSKSEELKETLTKAGVDCTLYPVEGLNHDLSTKYDVLLKQSAIFMYKQLTGKDVDIAFTGVINPEIQKIIDRQSKNPSYTAKNMKVTLDGKLDEWSEGEKIDLKQLKDAGTTWILICI